HVAADDIGLVHGQEINQRAGMNAERDSAGDSPARKLARASIVMPTQRRHAHFDCLISRPTSHIFRYRAARNSFITAITSPYGTLRSARRKIRSSLLPPVALSSALASWSRAIGLSPMASVRSGLSVREMGLCGVY